MQRTDFYLSLGLAVFSLIMLAWVIPGQAAMAEPYGMPPAAMPMICAAGIFVISLLLVIQTRPSRRRTQNLEEAPVSGKGLAKTGLNFATALSSLLIMNFAGFIAGGVFLIAAGMLTAGQRSPWIIGSCSLGVTLLTFFLLRYGLLVSLP